MFWVLKRTVSLRSAQKNRLIETVLLSTHNICFGREIRKIVFCYALLSGGLDMYNSFLVSNDFCCLLNVVPDLDPSIVTGGKPRNYHEIVLT